MAFAAFGTTVTNDATAGEVSAGPIAYDFLGLIQLSKANIGTWSLQLDMVDSGRVGGLGYIGFEYTVIPEPAAFGLMAIVGSAILFIRHKLML